MAQVHPIMRLQDWHALTSTGRTVMLFKHSTACPISAAAHGEFKRWAATVPEGAATLAEVLVIEQRPVSLSIAQNTGVKHESPQAILIDHGKVIWHGSHRRITQPALAAALAAHTSSKPVVP